MQLATLVLTTTRRAALMLGLLVALALLASPAARAAGPRPVFQLPFACGQTWEASTYDGHWPDQDSVDFGQWTGNANISKGEPVLASADGTVVEAGSDFDGNAVDGDPVLGHYVLLDHGGGWQTYYLHLEQAPPLADGQPVAQGEQIGRVGNSGTEAYHLHYTQMADGKAVRIAFNGTLIDTHAGNLASYETWGDGEPLTSLNCPTNTFLQFDLYGNRYELEYKPGTGAVAVDRLKSDGIGVSPVWSGTWTKGWTHFTPFTIGGQPYYFAYKSSTGEVDFDKINPFGLGVTTIGEGTWSKGWTHFMPFSLGGQPYYIAYNSLYGGANLDRINALGNGASTLWSGSWGKGWTHLVPFVKGGVQYFIAYQGGTGAVEIDKITGSGNSVSITEVWSGTWSTGWSHIVPLSHNGTVHLLKYRATTGAVSFEKVNAGGLGTQVLGTSGWTASWTTFSPFAVGGTAHVLLYKTGSGVVKVVKLNAGGTGMTTIWTGGWTTGWA